MGMAGFAGPPLAVQTCRRRLAPLEPADELVEALRCSISWHGPAKLAPDRPGSEASVQALSGLMHLHGSDHGRPRRIGLEVASVAAGVLAAQGTLAALIGQSRGHPVSRVQTSVLQAALVLSSHYIAAATTDDESLLPPAQPEPGPPFESSDGHQVEIETLDPEAWKAFWFRLGADGADLGRAWALFRARYYAGTCSLPPGLHEATARHSLAQLAQVAEACRVSLTRIRHYGEVLADPGWSAGHPVIEELVPSPFATLGVASARGGGSGPEAVRDADLPLAGIRVVETTTRMQGPLAGLLLQMLGAQVTKVEPPGGDFGRVVPPAAGDTGSFFLCFNRGKHTVELDLSSPAGRSELGDLVAGSDVFLHNWRPGKAAQWGLEADDLAQVNPGLVYAEASGWGALAEPAQLLGTDFLVQAYTGVGDGVWPEGDPAVPSRVLLTDCMGALNTCEGMLRGLYQREQTGRGCRVGTSLWAGAMSLQAHVLDALAGGHEARRRQGRPVWGPLDHPIETSDGVLVLSVDDDASRQRLGRMCGLEPGQANDLALAERLATGSARAWESDLVESGIACTAIEADADLADLPADPRLADLFEPLAGTSVAPRSPWTFG
jgi:crotonobetainyl-CoA:carnitine CoA-transferase CaiB-like acyl-CoA transferase